MQYLFQVAIGPVQSFIASARRSRDLWFGSHLLSEVSKIVARTIANEYKESWESSLIFPAPKSLEELDFGSDLNVANKIVACIDIADEEQVSAKLEKLGEAIRGNIDTKIDEIKDRVYREIKRNAENAGHDGEPFHEKMANAQIDDLVELSWAAVPYEGPYDQARKKLERLMAARKNTRNFSPVTWSEVQNSDLKELDLSKSSIDGQLESVIDQSFYPKDLKKREEQAKQLYKIFHAGPAERLSGVDLLKRLGTFKEKEQTSTYLKERQPEEDDFLSTSHIAAIPYLECLKRASIQEKIRPALRKYIDEVQKVLEDKLDFVPKGYKNYELLGKYDGALFYPERHRDKLMKGASLSEPQKKLKCFFDKVKEALPEATPSPYYAIICADGDRMGELIDTLAGKSDGDSKHRDLSKALDGFSREVKGIVEEHRGALIYAGGDDVLAFLPLHSVLNCAKELEKTFRNHLQSHAEGLDEEKRPSLSVGIAIVHHLTMLHEALNLARDAEKLAKGVKGKNALAITVNKRSGEQYSVAGRWDTLHSTLKLFIKYFRRDYLPRGVAYELRAMQERLTVIDVKKSDAAQKQDQQEASKQEQDGQEQGKKPGDGEILSDAARLKAVMYLEAKRILRRKLNLPQSRLASNVSAEERQKQEEVILNELLARIEGVSESSKEATTKVPLAEFIQELIVAQELAAAITLAEGKPPVEAQSKEENV